MSDDADAEARWRSLAAVTDAELAADVLADVDAVLVAFDAWRAGRGWREDDMGRRLYRVVESVRAAVAALPDRGDLAAAVAAVIPLLGEWWPRWPPPDAPATDAAVEQLRRSTMHRPAITRHARSIVALFDRDL